MKLNQDCSLRLYAVTPRTPLGTLHSLWTMQVWLTLNKDLAVTESVVGNISSNTTKTEHLGMVLLNQS